jgi:hypothetical protein
MGKLGDFLEVVYGPTDGFETVQASIQERVDERVLERVKNSREPKFGRKKPSVGRTSPIDATNLNVWVALPDKVRAETTRPCDNGVETSLEIVNGDRLWRIDHEGHVEAGGPEHKRRHGITDVDRHFSRSLLRQFFEGLDLQYLGEVRAADHDCIRLRAVPRADSNLWPHWLPTGVDEYEFHAEPRRGAIFTIIARRGGDVFVTMEVIRAVFDQPLDESLFLFAPHGGEQIRPVDTIREPITLEAAIQRMPFTVLVPARVPDPEHSDVEVMYFPPRMKAPHAHLDFVYRGSDLYDRLWIKQSARFDPESDKFEWETLRYGDRDLNISDPGEGGTRIVSLEQHGTHVTIWSDLDREKLLDLSSSLIPASSQRQS